MPVSCSFVQPDFVRWLISDGFVRQSKRALNKHCTGRRIIYRYGGTFLSFWWTIWPRTNGTFTFMLPVLLIASYLYSTHLWHPITWLCQLSNHNLESIMTAGIFTFLVLLIRYGNVVDGQSIKSLFQNTGKFPLVIHWEKTPLRAAQGTLEVSY